MVLGVLLFSVATFAGSFLLTKNHGKLERSELALYIVLIAWGSLVLGIVMSSASAAAD
jgi:hypothetical protein